ncbi:MAG: hypothetical protein EOP04_26650 [Proteobacteria bacterium]|nr:MAG: hypothetical protein EOP04_26650 [Pseudomonadota bacterium]
MKKNLPILLALTGVLVLGFCYYKFPTTFTYKAAQLAEISVEETAATATSQDVSKPTPAELSSVDRPSSENHPKLEVILAEQHKKIQTVAVAREEIRRNPHETPNAVLEAATALSLISSLDESEPSNKIKIDSFYKECSHDEKTLTVARAFCLKKLVERLDLKDDELAQVMGEMPDAVKNQYKKMVGIVL